MGIVKKMDWFKWLRKYSPGFINTKTGSMETLIDSVSSKTINYAYTSSVIADDEFINDAVPLHQRPMLPPPPTLQDSTLPPQHSNDVSIVYDCCVSLDGIPIKQEFQYTLTNIDKCGKITKHDIEGLASKILESMYDTTSKFSSQGQRTVKVTLNVRQSNAAVAMRENITPPLTRKHRFGRERKEKKMSMGRPYDKAIAAVEADPMQIYTEYPPGHPIYDMQPELFPYYRVKPGAEWYRHDQLIEMVKRSLAENLSFQTQGKSAKPDGHHRTRTRRRQSNASAVMVETQPKQPSVAKPKTPAKVAWSPYDFEPAAYTPSYHHRQHHHRQYHHESHHRSNRNRQRLYGVFGGDDNYVIKPSCRQQQNHRAAAAAIVSGNLRQYQSKDTVAQEHTKNIADHHQYKRAKMASKKVHHIHEHHHYHHYDYIV